MTKRQKIVQRALELVGCGYVYGATGWICTQKRLEQQAAQYPAQADNIFTHGKKWIGKACYDCAQLVRAAAKAAGISLPSGSTSQWRAAVYDEKDRIHSFPAHEEGILVFRQNPSNSDRMDHIGVSLGDGTTVEARGAAHGVVRRNFADGTWSHWARLLDCADDESSTANVDDAQTGYTATDAIYDITQILKKLEESQ